MVLFALCRGWCVSGGRQALNFQPMSWDCELITPQSCQNVPVTCSRMDGRVDFSTCRALKLCLRGQTGAALAARAFPQSQASKRVQTGCCC